MILDADAYRINIPAISSWRKNRPDEPLTMALSLMAITYSIPIIVLAHYVGELEGYSGDLKSFIERCMVFYRVDEVLGLRHTDLRR